MTPIKSIELDNLIVCFLKEICLVASLHIFHYLGRKHLGRKPQLLHELL